MRKSTITAALAAALALAIGLPGCAFFAPLHAPVAVDSVAGAQRAAQHAVDEANALRISINRVIEQNVRDGVWTPAQAQDYLDESKALGRRVDEARELLRLGDWANAQDRAEATRKLLLALQRKVAEQARKE